MGNFNGPCFWACISPSIKWGWRKPGMPHSKDAEEGERVWNSRDSADYNFGEQRIGLGSLRLYQEPWLLSRSKFPRKWVNGMRNPFSPWSGLGYSWFWVRDMMSQQQGLTHFVQVLTHLTGSLRQWCMWADNYGWWKSYTYSFFNRLLLDIWCMLTRTGHIIAQPDAKMNM